MPKAPLVRTASATNTIRTMVTSTLRYAASPLADAADHRALADLIQTLRRAGLGARPLLFLRRGLARRPFDRAHLLDDLFHFRGRRRLSFALEIRGCTCRRSPARDPR